MLLEQCLALGLAKLQALVFAQADGLAEGQSRRANASTAVKLDLRWKSAT